MFAGLHHVQLAMPAGQEARARAFFVDVLGMAEIDKPPVLAARGGAWFRAGHDVTPDRDFPGSRRCDAHDPFGNRLEFLEPDNA